MSRYSARDLVIGALALIALGLMLVRFVIYLFEDPRERARREFEDEVNRGK
jgi:hypothetical protein